MRKTVFDPEDLDGRLVVHLVAVDAETTPLAALDLGLVPEGRLGDLPLEEVLLDRGDDAAESADPVEVVVGLLPEPVRQRLDVITSRRAGRSC